MLLISIVYCFRGSPSSAGLDIPDMLNYFAILICNLYRLNNDKKQKKYKSLFLRVLSCYD